MIDDLTGFRAHLTTRGLSERTARSFGSDVALFLDWLQTDTGDMATAYALWLNEYRLALSPATVRRRLASGRAWLRYLKCDTAALDGYKAPPAESPQPHPVPGGMDTIIEMVDASEGAIRNAIALGGYAGLRVSESLSLTDEGYSTRFKQLRIRGKGNKVRRIPVNMRLRNVLADQQGRYVPFSDSWVRREVKRIAVECGLPDSVSSHDLRATFATETYRRTGDILMVSRLLGHSSVQTTQAYLHIGDESMAAGVDF